MNDIANKATDKATEVVADVAEKVGEEAIDFAEFTRRVSRVRVQYATFGWVLGAATGALFAYKFAYSRAETKFSKLADAEISEMREHYQAKARAVESEAAKRPVEDIVKERGYVSPEASPPPMAIQPPEKVVVEKPEEETEEEPPAQPATEVNRVVRNIFRERLAERDGWVEPEWNYHEELRKRSPDIPYVVHTDEKDEMEYQEVTLTYYAGDDVLCDDRDEPIGTDDRDALIGDGNLDRFGHGSGDPNVVYIRNDRLEILYEICKNPNSFAEEVHGFSHQGYYRGNLERMRARERDDPDE